MNEDRQHAADPAPSRRRRFVRKLGLAAAGCLCGVILAEGILRLVGISYPQPYAPDATIGTRLQPNFSAWFTREGQAWVTTNSAGFRDREHALTKPKNTYRIVVLGDSYAEALQVDQTQTFWSLLERKLGKARAAGDRNIEVLNFGISGFGTTQQLLVLRHEALSYDPDLVLLAFLSGNDIRNNSIDLEPVRTRPFHTLKDDALVLDTSFRKHPDFLKAQSEWTKWKVDCINRSRLLQLFYEVRNNSGRMREAVGQEVGLDETIYRPPANQHWEDAWHVTERLLKEMNQTCVQADADFVVATVTNAIQVAPRDEAREQFMSRIGVTDLDYPDRRVGDVGAREGFPVITLAGPLRQHARKHDVYLHGFANSGLGQGHWNEKGHRVAAHIITAELLKVISSEPH